MMRARLYTWHDIEELLWGDSERWPTDWAWVDATVDELFIGCTGEQTEEARLRSTAALQQMFGAAYSAQDSCIALESASDQNRIMRVSLLYDADVVRPQKPTVPLFADRGTGRDDGPSVIPGAPPVYAFYSYKGGVGRTLSLVAWAKSLLTLRQNCKVLLVDADLEAPGLTWLARESGAFRHFSLLDAMALVHSSENWRSDVLGLIQQRVAEETLSIPVGDSTAGVYLLPAFRCEEQLIRMPVSSEILLRAPGRQWVLGDMLFELGKRLQVDAVLVDLRAGVSELSAPVLLDPRVQQVLVSTTSSQSVQGTEFVLRSLRSRRTPKGPMWRDPIVLLSMVPHDLDPSVVTGVFSRIHDAYPLPESGDGDVLDQLSRLPILPLTFASELVHLDGIPDIIAKLSGTAMEAAIRGFIENTVLSARSGSRPKRILNAEESLSALMTFCGNMEYGERTGDGLMKTPPLRALGRKFATAPPAAVVLGAKGSGKTFTYFQVLRSRSWRDFVRKVADSETLGPKQDILYPLAASRNLREAAVLVADKRQSAIDALGFSANTNGASTELLDSVERATRSGDAQFEGYWRGFWIGRIVSSMGLSDAASLSELNQRLVEGNAQVTFLVDGLEDLFPHAHSDLASQAAIRALCQGVMEVIHGLPDRRIGLLVFVRPDIAGAAIPQNFGQFRSIYEPYELKWGPDDALRLVAWASVSAGFKLGRISHPDAVEGLPSSQLREALRPLWGRKMGPDNAREALTSSWVLAAIADLKGRLQARDVMRFLHYAAKESKGVLSGDKTFRPDRLLQVQAIKRAIKPCGQEKILEIEKEIPSLKNIFAKIRRAPDKDRRVPFNPDKLELSFGDIEVLKVHGVVVEEQGEYYTSEIYRQGLELSLDKGARPKVLVLLRRAASFEGILDA